MAVRGIAFDIHVTTNTINSYNESLPEIQQHVVECDDSRQLELTGGRVCGSYR